MGPNAVQDPSALIAAVKSQQPAQAPGTPLERLDPDKQALENIKAASVSLDRAGQFTNDPMMLIVFSAMSGTLSKALLKFDGASVMQSLVEAVQSFPPQQFGPPPPPDMGMPPPMPGPMGAPASMAPPPVLSRGMQGGL